MARRKPIELPWLFLRDRVLIPGSEAIIFVGRERTVAAVNAANKSTKQLFMSLQKKRDEDEPSPDHMYTLGAIGYISKHLVLPDKTLKITVKIRSFGRLLAFKDTGKYWASEVGPISQRASEVQVKKKRQQLVALFKKHGTLFERRCIAHLSMNTPIVASETAKAFKNYVRERRANIGSKPVTISKPFTIMINRTMVSLGELIHKGTSKRPLYERNSNRPSYEIKKAIDKFSRGLFFRRPIELPKDGPDLPNLLNEILLLDYIKNKTKQTVYEKSSAVGIANLILEKLKSDIKVLSSSPVQKQDRPLIFISHAAHDKKRIKPILLGLLGVGFRLFIDRPEELGLASHPLVMGLTSGPFRSELSKALRQSSCVLALWSAVSTSGQRTELYEEAAFGKERGILVQATIDPLDSILKKIPLGFKEWQLFDLSDNLKGQKANLPIDVSLLVREINDVIKRNPNTLAPLSPWAQASTSVGMAVIQQQLRTFPKPPPPVSPINFSTLDELRLTFLKQAVSLAERLRNSNHPLERDIASTLDSVITQFNRPLEEIDLVLAPSVGELIFVLRSTYSDPDVRRELSSHVAPALNITSAAYDSFISKWGAWADQNRDPAKDWVTPENADRTREAADIVIEFTKSASIVHDSVPNVLRALRQLISPALSFSRFNEYRYLNAIGEGLRACWNEGERYINEHWAEMQTEISSGNAVIIGPFNEFFLEMADVLTKLSQANPTLFGWLFVRVGYLKRLKAGDFIQSPDGESCARPGPRSAGAPTSCS
jgi:hypothetical protein